MYSDHELIEMANKGDSEAFETIYYRYRDRVYSLALRFTDNRHDALDVLQETFIYILGKFPGFELTSSMTTFLYPVVKHISFSIHQKNHRLAKENTPQSTSSIPVFNPPDDSLSELSAVLAVLPDQHREVVLMRFVDDMSLADIAEALSTPLSTVKSRLYNALETLRNDRRTKNYFLE